MVLYEDGDLLIRFMIEEDCDKIVEAFKFQNWNKDINILKNYYTEQVQGNRYVLIAEVMEDLAGYITLLPEAKFGPFADEKMPEIVDFNVFIKYQNRSIGSKLMYCIENIAKNISDTVSLGVGLHYGYGSAQRMYVKRGYIFDGSGVWYKNKQLEQYSKCENNDDLVLYMTKELLKLKI
ncbi:MAG: GNAT family N-acetyltransferase [Romboutsia sp.]